MHFCSIAAGVKPAALRLTFEDVRRVHPSATVVVLDVDGVCADWDGVEVLDASDIGVETIVLHTEALLRTPAQLRAWLLPRLLAHLVGRGDVAIHLAAGMRVLAPLDALGESAREHGLGLVARSERLPPDDGWSPTAADMLAAGPFRTAVLAAGPQGAEDLAAWVSAADLDLSREWQMTLVAVSRPVWPASTVVSRWRVDATTAIVRDGEQVLCDGTEVRLVDLTEFDPDRPWLLSPVDAETARTRFSDHPVLGDLCADHAAELRAAEADAPGAPRAPFSETSDGMRVDTAVRQAFKDGLREWRRHGAPAPPDPFDTADPTAFTRWLDQVVTDGVPLTRYLLGLYDSRPDLAREFPHVPGGDSQRLVAWAERHAKHEPEHNYSARLLDSASRTARAAQAQVARSPKGRRPAGLNVAGYLNGELGIGESARLMLKALRSTPVRYSTISVDRHLQSRQRAELGGLHGAEVRFDISLLCVNADQTGAVLDAEPDLLRSSYRIGMWYWEVEDFPASMHGGFGHLDEVWVASDFVREAVAKHTTLPVVTITPPLPQASAPTQLTRSDLGLPEDRPVFLFSFDYLSTAERKNPIGLVDAFRRAFAPGEGPVLVVKSINADKRVGDAERLRLRVAGEPDVILLERYLDAEHRDALVQHCDAYVSLHRSEGLGLTIAEAMAHGKPVIATAYSGNMQFMTEENAFLVPWTPATVPENCEPYPAGSRWAQPDLDAAARAMRLVIEDPALAAARGARAAWDVRELHSPGVAGSAIVERLTQIRRELPRIAWRSRARRVRDIARRAGLR